MSKTLHLYLVSMDIAEEPPELRKYFQENKAIELSFGTWIIPSCKHFAVVWSAVRELAGQHVGIVLFPLLPDLTLIRNQGRDDVVEELKSLGVRTLS